MVPSLGGWKIVQIHHDDMGHVGLNRYLDLNKSDYWFSKMTRFIKKMSPHVFIVHMARVLIVKRKEYYILFPNHQ